MINFPDSPTENEVYPPLNQSPIEGRRWIFTNGVWLNYSAEQQFALQIYNVINLSSALNSRINKVNTDTTPVDTIRCITMAEYDAIPVKDPNTIYMFTLT